MTRILFGRRSTGATFKAEVQSPGSRGGTYYIDERGHVRYGLPPPGAVPFHGVASHILRSVVAAKRSGFFAGRKISSSTDTAEIFRDATDFSVERFWMVHLDKSDRPIAVELVSQGNLVESLVHPRDVFKTAMQMGTASVSFMHNHPSGEPLPSAPDMAVSKLLATVGRRIGIQVKHHVVMGTEGFTAITGPNLGEIDGPDQVTMGPTQNKTPLKRVESKIPKSDDQPPWSDVLKQPVRRPYDAYLIGQKLVNPNDKVALLLSLDQQRRVIGVFPLAYDEIDPGILARAVRTAIGSNAAGVILVAGKDGQEWQRRLNETHLKLTDELSETAKIKFHDTIVVGSDGYSSFEAEGSVVDPRSPWTM